MRKGYSGVAIYSKENAKKVSGTLGYKDFIDDEGRTITIADEVGGISYINRGILVQGTGGQLINGNTSVLMKIERMSLTFLYRNSSWKTI
jgi:hypothetical protein